MEAIPVLVSLIPLALIVLVGWAIVRAVGRAGPARPSDPATIVRQLFVHGLLFAGVLVVTQGAIELIGELAEPGDDRSTATMARALAFLVVGIPLLAALARSVDRRLRIDDDEHRSMAWTVYLNAVLLVGLFGAMIEAQSVLQGAMASPAERSFEGARLATFVVWALVWSAHWFHFRRRYRPIGDLDLAIGTVVGLAPLALGVGGLVSVATHELYAAAVDDPGLGDGPSFDDWAATAIVGAAVWSWYWLVRFRRSARTEAWYTTVVPIAALGGFVATIVGLASAGYLVVVWLVGDPDATTAARHFDDVPVLAGVVGAGGATLWYHRSLLGPATERNTPIRAYDHVLALAALVAGVAGLTVLLSAVLADPSSPAANTLIAGATLTAVGGPTWWRVWARIERYANSDRPEVRAAELSSPLRRVYLVLVFGLGATVVVVALLTVLTVVFEDLLDGTVSRSTLDDGRIGIGLVLSVAGAAWYHYRIHRRDRSRGQARQASPTPRRAAAPTPPPEPMPSPTAPAPSSSEVDAP